MKIEDILTLMQAFSDSELTEINVSYDEEGKTGKNGRVSFSASKNAKETVLPQSNMAQLLMQPVTQGQIEQPQVAAENTVKKEEVRKGECITSPMVGTFYAAPNEGAEPFVLVGDTVKKGQVVGIIEAMKLMNEIESPYDGVVEEILIENKAMVGFGDELILVRPK